MDHDTSLPDPTRVLVGGAEIATYRLGPEHATSAGDVVLCHGTPWSARSWMPIARMLAERHRVFLWDMPGYGSSISDDAPPADLVHQRERLAALIALWGLDRPHVLAHDIGGAVALGAHLLEGVEFASLYLVDIVTLAPWGSPFFRLVAQHEEVFAALPSNLHAALVREYIIGAGGEGLDARWIDALVEPWRSRAGQSAFYRQIAQLSQKHTEPIVRELGRVRCRTRIGWGERDPWIPVSQATELAALLPCPVDVITFPDSGHLAPLEATAALGEDALDWLR
ncbi:alpha/beta fold hydrolase [Microbacterium karelineae]|uniref:alpha/beta fold hydrolase n=1 Tax=Microbacterium karelineae TaxID=2654283 RepID=UPI0012EA306B|nr:alpha/beta hydrolase [Microbacterium karelineae]